MDLLMTNRTQKVFPKISNHSGVSSIMDYIDTLDSLGIMDIPLDERPNHYTIFVYVDDDTFKNICLCLTGYHSELSVGTYDNLVNEKGLHVNMSTNKWSYDYSNISRVKRVIASELNNPTRHLLTKEDLVGLI